MGNTEKLYTQESHRALLSISVNNNLSSRYVDTRWRVEGPDLLRCAGQKPTALPMDSELSHWSSHNGGEPGSPFL